MSGLENMSGAGKYERYAAGRTKDAFSCNSSTIVVIYFRELCKTSRDCTEFYGTLQDPSSLVTSPSVYNTTFLQYFRVSGSVFPTVSLIFNERLHQIISMILDARISHSGLFYQFRCLIIIYSEIIQSFKTIVGESCSLFLCSF